MSFLFTSLFGSRFKTSPPFEEWAATATRADIHKMFVQILKEGDAETGFGESVSSEQLERFDCTISNITQSVSLSPSCLVPLQALIHHLSFLDTQQASFIKAASIPLIKLLQTHASFPFLTDSEKASLLPEEILRAILLLTSNCEKLFTVAAWLGGEVTIRERTAKQRIAFVFASLVEPPARSSSVDDVLDVLCRVPYPRVKDSSGDLARRELKDLVPVAQRLLEQEDNSRTPHENDLRVFRDTLEPLAGLIAIVNGTSVAKIRGNNEGVTRDEFERWAIDVDLLGALDKLFIGFLGGGGGGPLCSLVKNYEHHELLA